MSARPSLTISRRIAGAVALVFAATSVFSLAAPSPAAAWSENAFSAASENELVALTNQSRAAAGRKALKVDSELRSIARWRSKDMIQRDYFSHDIPGYGSVFDVMSDKGYCYHIAGENIGWNNAERQHRHPEGPQRLHGLVRAPRQHPRQGLGRHRDRGVQGRERQEDVDRHLRRPMRDGEGEAARQAEAEGHEEADAEAGPAIDPEADEEADAQADADPARAERR